MNRRYGTVFRETCTSGVIVPQANPTAEAVITLA